MTEPDVDLETIPEPDEDEVFIRYDITTYPSDFTLWGMHEMWGAGAIEIPDFQREFVWTMKQSSLLIESFLMGLPVPPVFFYIDDENKNLVIDGQQRILSAVFFFDELFGNESQGRRTVFRLTGLDERSPFAGKRFSDLSESDQRKLKQSVLRAINVRQISPDKHRTSIYHIFERLNTGGTPLKPQEIRNCVFRGKFASILRTLNSDVSWRQLLGKPSPDKHQKDIELVLRLFALSGQRWKAYEKPMKEFLNLAMSENQKGSAAVDRFVSGFPQAAKLIVDKLGRKPFHVRGPLNSAVLDAVFCVTLDNLSRLPSDYKDRFATLLDDDDFNERTRGGTTDTAVVRHRFVVALEHLIE